MKIPHKEKQSGLCLTFKPQESAVIRIDGREVRVQYVERHGNQIRLIFHADDDVLILREKLAQRIDQEGFQPEKMGGGVT